LKMIDQEMERRSVRAVTKALEELKAVHGSDWDVLIVMAHRPTSGYGFAGTVLGKESIVLLENAALALRGSTVGPRTLLEGAIGDPN